MRNYFYWLYRTFCGEILAIPGRLIAVLFFIFLFSIPVITTHPYVLRVIIFTAIFAIFAASWDLLTGFTGQVNLGQALFFGVGAYSTAFLNRYFLGIPPWVTIPLGSICAVIAGLITCMPALRLRGLYLALVTLSFPIILTGILLAAPEFAGGELGISGISPLSDSRIINYYFIVLIMMFSLLIMWKLTDEKSNITRIGIILRAIREDEITARISGINTTRYKLIAFAVSGFFGGIGGSLYAHFTGTAGPSTLELFLTFQAILWTIFGGIATIYGPVAGVFILYPSVEFMRLSEVGEAIRFLLLGFVMIFSLVYMPEGVIFWVRHKLEVSCLRCKVVNARTRSYCRVCHAPLLFAEKKSVDKKK